MYIISKGNLASPPSPPLTNHPLVPPVGGVTATSSSAAASLLPC